MLGQLVISHSQRLLFAATAELDRPGSVRIYKFPLTGDFVEYPCLSSPGKAFTLHDIPCTDNISYTDENLT